jgi:serine/threonine protein kinase
MKFLPPELMRDSEAKERFSHEAQAAAALEHQNICNILNLICRCRMRIAGNSQKSL